MCLAVAPDKQTANRSFFRIWRNVASTPLRLLSFCAFAHVPVLAGLFMRDLASGSTPDIHAYLVALCYGLLALLAFGHLLTWLPKKYSLSPVHYGRYNTIFLLMMTGLFNLEAGIILDINLVPAGMLFLIPAWLIALQSLAYAHIWISANAQQISKIVLILLTLNLVTLMVSVGGRIFGTDTFALATASLSTLLVWPLLSVAMLVLLLIAPAKGRVISL